MAKARSCDHCSKWSPPAELSAAGWCHEHEIITQAHDGCYQFSQADAQSNKEPIVMVQAVEITEEMVLKAARALDRQALIAQGWTAPAIQRVMTEVKRPAAVSIKTAETVLFAAFVGTPLNEEHPDA